MANAGKNTNGSQFFVTFAPCSWLDGKHVVFGRVESGFEQVCQRIERLQCNSQDKPNQRVVISNCGEIKKQKEEPKKSSETQRVPEKPTTHTSEEKKKSDEPSKPDSSSSEVKKESTLKTSVKESDESDDEKELQSKHYHKDNQKSGSH